MCDEWHNFQNFAKWHHENYVCGWAIDKDILQLNKKNKIYSPTTCVFVPIWLNSVFTNNQKTNTTGHTGVCFHSRDKKYYSYINDGKKNRINLGYFENIDDASNAYDDQLKKKLYTLSFKAELEGVDSRVVDVMRYK